MSVMLDVTAMPLVTSFKCQVMVLIKTLTQGKVVIIIVTLIWAIISGALSMILGKGISTPWRLHCILAITFLQNIMTHVIAAVARQMPITLTLT